MPPQDRVLVRWKEPLRQDGLLTGAQVILFLGDLFRQFQTETFSLQSGSYLPQRKLYHCMGRWSLHSNDGHRHRIELHFSLKKGSEVWTIRELRQIR
ncbi:MAG: hypothetical protein V3U98_07665 [Acidobacteriota bacterium]